MNYKVHMSYDGSQFYGFQRQVEERTIQAELEKVLSLIFKEEVTIHGSGRTDAGVHAHDQVFSFSSPIVISEEKLSYALNRLTPRDILIKEVHHVSEDFHARFSAKGKSYLYKLSKKDDLFKRNYRWYIKEELDVLAMRKAASFLIGEHDFFSFSNRRKEEKSTIRTIEEIEIREVGEEIHLYFKGNGFLYKMVRILTMYLLQVGLGRIHPEKTETILNSHSRVYTREVAPPEGLYLWEVYY